MIAVWAAGTHWCAERNGFGAEIRRPMVGPVNSPVGFAHDANHVLRAHDVRRLPEQYVAGWFARIWFSEAQPMRPYGETP